MISQNEHYIAGRKKFEAQEFEEALHLFNKAIEAEENPSIYSERAVVYFYLGRLDKSMEDMNYAASLEPSNPYRFSSRAYIRDAMGDLDGAIEDYERAVALDPEDSIAYNNLGLLLEKKGYRDKAQEHYRRADELADVEELLRQVRAEQQELEHESEPPQAEIRDRASLSLWGLLRATFTTKAGFQAYLRFIRNGFKA